ncbi:MAG TPA: hypothetical protein VGU72_20160 [Beijerinckiaceae bacterium]|jgi:hypothetical protein|nr:hypothetical protein [Beijerinckiaceae bacterium]
MSKTIPAANATAKQSGSRSVLFGDDGGARQGAENRRRIGAKIWLPVRMVNHPFAPVSKGYALVGCGKKLAINGRVLGDFYGKNPRLT